MDGNALIRNGAGKTRIPKSSRSMASSGNLSQREALRAALKAAAPAALVVESIFVGSVEHFGIAGDSCGAIGLGLLGLSRFRFDQPAHVQ